VKATEEARREQQSEHQSWHTGNQTGTQLWIQLQLFQDSTSAVVSTNAGALSDHRPLLLGPTEPLQNGGCQ
jgi:hypothetical protein